MTTSYPTGLDSFTNPTVSDNLDTVTVYHDEQHANINDAVEAIQATLGTDPQGGSATVKARIAAAETSIAGKEAAGTAAGLLATHEAAADPHPGYLLESAAATGGGLPTGLTFEASPEHKLNVGTGAAGNGQITIRSPATGGLVSVLDFARGTSSGAARLRWRWQMFGDDGSSNSGSDLYLSAHDSVTGDQIGDHVLVFTRAADGSFLVKRPTTVSALLTASASLAVTGTIVATDDVTAQDAKVGTVTGGTGYAYFGHKDRFTTTEYAFATGPSGDTYFNGASLAFLIDNSTKLSLSATAATFGSGVNLTASNIKRGTGSPEGAVTGVVGDIYQRTDGGTDTTLYRKESGTGNTGWVAVAAGGGGGVSDGDKGDITVSGSGATWTIDGNVVTAGKLAASATDKLFGRSSSGAGAGEEIPCTAAGRALLDDADAAAQRTTLGLAAVASSGSASDLSTGTLALARLPQEVPRVIGSSGTSASHTGDTNETTLATITLAANALKAGGSLEIDTLWSYTNSANNKNMRVRFGGTQMLVATTTTTGQLHRRVVIWNATTSSQKAYANSNTTGVGATTGTPSTAAIDTTASVSITITAQLTNTGETITLEGYTITIRNPPA